MLFSDAVRDHATKPRGVGPPTSHTHRGRANLNPDGGPYVTLFLTVESGVVKSCHFNCNGCIATTIAGSAIAELLPGRSVAEALRLEPADVLAVLGPVPEGKEYGAELAVRAFRKALESEDAQTPGGSS